MAYEDLNQLLESADLRYYNRHQDPNAQTNSANYNPGRYQFIKLDTLIDQFYISHVGSDKLISKVNKLDIRYHASRALQEFSYDILRSHKGLEFDVPANLNMILPEDFVGYNRVSYIDDNGLKRPILYNHDTSNPFAPLQSNSNNISKEGNFSLFTKATLYAGSNFVKLDAIYPEIYSHFIHAYNTKPSVLNYANPELFDLVTPGLPAVDYTLAYGVWHDKSVNATWVELKDANNNNVNAIGNAQTILEWKNGGSNSQFNLIPKNVDRVIVYNPVFNINSAKMTAPSPGDVKDIKVGMRLVGSRKYWGREQNYVIDVDYDNGHVYIAETKSSQQTLAPGAPGNAGFFQNSTVVPTGSAATTGWTQVPSITFVDSDIMKPSTSKRGTLGWWNAESDTLQRWNNQSNNDTVEEDDIWRLRSERYGLDPTRSNRNGSFYIDQKAGKIRFSSDLVGKKVVIDYISDSMGHEDEQMCHKFAEEAIYKYMAYAILSTKANIPEYVVARAKKERFAEMRKAKLRLSNINLREFNQIMRGKSKQIKH